MKRKVAVLTDNPYLYQKLYLMLSDECEVFDTASPINGPYEVIFADIDTVTEPGGDGICRIVRLGKSAGADITIPFGEADILSLFKEGESTEQSIILGDRCAYLRGQKIRLTDVEFALLSALFERCGEFVTREELLRSVWQSEKSEGVLNVYIHYLREKLETTGEKIILSSRKYGYKIDEKYLRNSKKG